MSGTTLWLALRALGRSRMRSALTMLGVVIGVAAVLMMESLGAGATMYISQSISGLGSNMLMVVPGSPTQRMGGGAAGAPLFQPGDLDAIRRGAPQVAHLAAVSSRTLRAVAGGLNRNTPVSGVSAEYLEIRDWSVVQGRALSADDERQAAQVCVVGHTVASALFGDLDAVGREVRIRDVACRVVGVLESKGSAAFGMDQDDILLMPLSTFSRRIVGSDRIALIVASAGTTDRIDDAKLQMERVLRQRRHVLAGEEDDFAVRDPRELLSVLSQITEMLTTFLLGVAGISLLVGGIGIMNIMLVSVTERTREIGVRLAVGARGDDILSQFLVEAIVLSGAGGILGVALGVISAYGLAHVIGVPFVFPTAAIPVAFVVALLVGVGFGVFPARKAARLNPLAALRFE